jgi:serine/threonine protein kinase
MSPEQIRGDALDGRSDLYAIGCLMVECLTGSPPFRPLTITQLVSDHLFRIPKFDQLSEINPELPAILEKCLAKDRNKRFGDVAQLRDACRGCQADGA